MLAYGANYEEPQLAAVETLMAAGADFNMRSADGYTALEWASMSENAPIAPIIQALVRHGADVNSNREGDSALHNAAGNDYVDSINALIEAGAAAPGRGDETC